MRLTISGPPGSGKTTVCKLVAERLHLEVIISGNIFRQLAKEASMSLSDFGTACEMDPEVDRKLDARMVEIASSRDDVLLEGRLTAHMLTRHGIPAFRVYMDADLDVRAARVAEREGGIKARRKREIVEREECERHRYLAYYGIDVLDRNIYDLIIDTTYLTPKQVADRICEAVTLHE
ncbi:MAG: AAA family ATPase [Methanomassiliicoccus sp.]|nr:AAA family ATPase [Methanomassiliicoccus sp.]